MCVCVRAARDTWQRATRRATGKRREKEKSERGDSASPSSTSIPPQPYPPPPPPHTHTHTHTRTHTTAPGARSGGRRAHVQRVPQGAHASLQKVPLRRAPPPAASCSNRGHACVCPRLPRSRLPRPRSQGDDQRDITEFSQSWLTNTGACLCARARLLSPSRASGSLLLRRRPEACRAGAAAACAARSPPLRPLLFAAAARQWTTKDVVSWLHLERLDTFIEPFMREQITGRVGWGEGMPNGRVVFFSQFIV